MTWRISKHAAFRRSASPPPNSSKAPPPQAKSLGIDPALVFVPHPVQDRTDDELKKLADDHLEPILALLVKG